MAARPSLILVLAGALASLGASFRTQNFVIEAPTPQFAQQVGQYAEHYRREKAIAWLGQEMRPWPQPCPVRVTVTMNGSGGATSFNFGNGYVIDMDMHIEGTADRLLASVLPHEITHTVFAHYFRQPVPRWADEGGSVLSEDEQERNHHDYLVRQILNTPGRAIPLRRLFTLSQYPRDVMVLYAEGYSVTNFLVNQSGRPAFLGFIATGMRGDWDGAVRTYYRYNSIEELERAWVRSLSQPRPAAGTQLAGTHGRTEGEPASRVVVRQTVPPAQPLLEAPQPVFRGQAPGPDDYDPPPAARSRQPAYPAPPAAPSWSSPAQPLWQPPAPPAQVQLLPPQFDMAPPPLVPRSPVGYSP
jgi:hypothetical protein